MREKITATYKIVTPMFIGDANKEATDISPSSVKGALRFWWRALNWGRALKDTEQDEAKALRQLHKEEATLFGSLSETKKDKLGNNTTEGGQGVFLLRVINGSSYQTTNSWPLAQEPSGYLGIGLWKSGSTENGNLQAHREAIEENQVFSVELWLKPSIQTEQKQELNNVLKIWGLLGGLGSRARRGFGSIAIENLNGIEITFNSIEAYIGEVKKIFERYVISDLHPSFTALSKHSQMGLAASKNNARSAHAELGILFKNYRGQPSSLRGSIKRVFGMPYSGGTTIEAEARRASPLFFHIHPIAKKFKGVAISFPAVFHHDQRLESVDYSLVGKFFSQVKEVALWK